MPQSEQLAALGNLLAAEQDDASQIVEDLLNLFRIGCAGVLHKGAPLRRAGDGLRVALAPEQRLLATAHTPGRRFTLDAPATAFEKE